VALAAAAAPAAGSAAPTRAAAAAGAAAAARGGGAAQLRGADWAAFLARLAFANARSAQMTTLQYVIYGRCREAGFTGSIRLKAAFARCLPPPALSDAALDVLAYIAYDRVSAIVEAANVLHCGGGGGGGGSGGGGAAGGAPAPVHTMESLPLAAYEAAARSQLPLPLELHDVFVAAAAARRRALTQAAAPPPRALGVPPRALGLPPPRPAAAAARAAAARR